ncbi:hypothetical protein Tco_1350249, partial [Tanacetum coccineum]
VQNVLRCHSSEKLLAGNMRKIPANVTLAPKGNGVDHNGDVGPAEISVVEGAQVTDSGFDSLVGICFTYFEMLDVTIVANQSGRIQKQEIKALERKATEGIGMEEVKATEGIGMEEVSFLRRPGYSRCSDSIERSKVHSVLHLHHGDLRRAPSDTIYKVISKNSHMILPCILVLYSLLSVVNIIFRPLIGIPSSPQVTIVENRVVSGALKKIMHYVSATASSKSNESPSKNNELELVVMVLHFMLLKR